jgi:aryl-alcohol dehydrogenase-like predicted oxidoreductase
MIEKLILGTVQMGLNYGVNNHQGQISFSQSIEILFTAFKSGINTLDTAELYGNAHEVIGKFHERYPSLRYKIITKLPSVIDSELFNIKIKKYIDDLKVDSLEAIMFHSFESYISNKDKITELLILKKEGIIKKIGVSIYTNEQIEHIIEDTNIDIIQLPFNLFDNEYIRGNYINKAKRFNKEIHTRSCFLQGLFFKSLSSENKIAVKLKKSLNYINQLSVQNDLPITDLALGYCLNQKKIDKVLIGVDSLDHLNQNIKSAEINLNSDIIEKINGIRIENTEYLNPSLWSKL